MGQDVWLPEDGTPILEAIQYLQAAVEPVGSQAEVALQPGLAATSREK